MFFVTGPWCPGRKDHASVSSHGGNGGSFSGLCFPAGENHHNCRWQDSQWSLSYRSWNRWVIDRVVTTRPSRYDSHFFSFMIQFFYRHLFLSKMSFRQIMTKCNDFFFLFVRTVQNSVQYLMNWITEYKKYTVFHLKTAPHRLEVKPIGLYLPR